MNVRNPGPSILAKARHPLRTSRAVAGVTHSTVSRALRDSPLVNRETVEKIQRIAVKQDTVPSAAARSLVNRRSDTIGVVVTNIADPFVAGVVSGIEEMADQHGLSVFLANSNAEPEREVRVARKFERAPRGWHHRHRVPRGRAVRAAVYAHAGAHRAAQQPASQPVRALRHDRQCPGKSGRNTPPDCTGPSPDCLPGRPLRASVRYGAVFRLPAGAA
mgnify:CR=1 FL=1